MRLPMMIAAALLSCGIAFVGWLIYEEMEYKIVHHCVNVGEPKTYIAPQYIYGVNGQVVGMYFANYTTFLYQCDNGLQRF